MAQGPEILETIELNGPDDFHLHLRNAESLPLLVEHTAVQVERALVMPNTKPPITTVPHALRYYAEIKKCVPKGHSFEPLMSLYLTDLTRVEDVVAAAASSKVFAFKLYPKHATTNSAHGVSDIRSAATSRIFSAMQKHDVLLCVHGEVNIDSSNQPIDIFEREQTFIDNELRYILHSFPRLRVVLEHVTTRKAVQFVTAYNINAQQKQTQNLKSDSESEKVRSERNRIRLAATITAHHLMADRNDIFKGNRVNPHMFCLPILKRREDKEALRGAAVSGLPWFFAGSDSAPHTRDTKECSHGCAGIYTAFNVLSLYAETFWRAKAMAKMNDFVSGFGADFYDIARNVNKVRMVRLKGKVAPRVPDSFVYLRGEKLVPFMAGETLEWCLQRQMEHEYTAEQKYTVCVECEEQDADE